MRKIALTRAKKYSAQFAIGPDTEGVEYMSIKNTKIGQVYLWKKSVFIQMNSDAQFDDLRIKCGPFETLLQKTSNAVELESILPLLGEFQLRKHHEMIPTAQLDGVPAEKRVEATQATSTTPSDDIARLMKFKLPDAPHPYVFGVGPKIALKLQALHGRAEVRLLAAIQNCDAALAVRFFAETTGHDHVIEVPLDPNFAGGHRASDFQKIVVQCPFEGSCTVAITVVVRASPAVPEGFGVCAIANASAIADVIAPRDAGVMARPLAGKTGAFDQGEWYSASLRSLIDCDGATIELVYGADHQTLLQVPSNRITMIEDFGHGITVCASRKCEALLSINAVPLRRITIDETATFIEFPSQYLTGEPHEVTLLDTSGSQILFQMPILSLSIATPAEALREHSKAPYPVEMTTRQALRYRGLKQLLGQENQRFSPHSIKNALDHLESGEAGAKLQDLVFPTELNPDVSVIIPVHNNLSVTYNCLCALLVAANKASFEVIVVDDGSTDATVDLALHVHGVTFLRNDLPQRFIRACNTGVAAARGQYVVLLNNDTEPTVGWLDALIRVFETQPDAGLAGSKLLYPDGRLQDAGGIVWASGNPWNYGNGDSPWHPKYSYTRQADYLSGAALMTRRAIWDKLGGLSAYLEPMYFEDTDFAFKVREAGYKTYFVPSSVVYHFEGLTSGTDISAGFKRYQEINRPKFKRRWASAFARNGKEGSSPDLEKDRNISGRILFVDTGVPREDRDAGSYAARREIELVQSLGYKVTFLPQNLAHLGVYTDDLAASGVEVVHAPFYRSIRQFFAERGAEFDAVYMTRYHVAQSVLPLVREFCPSAKTILNNADLHFLRELRAAINAKDPNRIAGMREVRDQELAVMQEVDLVLSYNSVEHVVIASHTDGAAKVMECPWVVTAPRRIHPITERSEISFIGSFRHAPNREGIKWFCQDIMPALGPHGTQLFIYGSEMDDEIRALKSDLIHPVGYVEDQEVVFHKHRIFVAPLLSGAGLKGKVISALAHGIPTVMTPIAAEGIGLRSGLEAIVAETVDQWVDAINRLNRDDDHWKAISSGASKFAAETYSFRAGREKIAAAFEAVDLFGTPL